MDDHLIPFMNNQWLQIDGDVVTMGISEEGLEDIDNIVAVDMPAEDDEVQADEICGELDSRDGPLNVYSPLDGVVIEVNAAVIDTPELIREDPYGEGWILRIEAHDNADIDKLTSENDDDDEASPDDD